MKITLLGTGAKVYGGVIAFGEDLMELSADPKTPGIFL